MERHHIVNCYRNAPADSSSRRAADTRFVEDDEDTMASCTRRPASCNCSAAARNRTGRVAGPMKCRAPSWRPGMRSRGGKHPRHRVPAQESRLTAWRLFRPSGSTRVPRTSWLPGPSLEEAPRIPLLEISRLRRLSVSSFKHHNPAPATPPNPLFSTFCADPQQDNGRTSPPLANTQARSATWSVHSKLAILLRGSPAAEGQSGCIHLLGTTS